MKKEKRARQKRESLILVEETLPRCPHCHSRAKHKIRATRKQEIGGMQYCYKYRTCMSCKLNFVSRYRVEEKVQK